MNCEEWTKIRDDLSKGDRAAFERLYNSLWRRLYAVAFNYVREKETARELVQETFIKLWINRSRLATVADVTAFSVRAIQHRVFDHFDRRAIEDRYVTQLSQRPALKVDDTHHQVEYDESFSLLNCEIEKLPDTTKKIFKLSRFDQFSNEEIASSLRLSVKAVEYHITQSLKHLRIRLGHLLTILPLVVAIVRQFISRGDS